MLTRQRNLTRVPHCLNCDEVVTGHYCAACGQEAVDQTTAVAPLLSEFVAETLSLEGKLWRTLGALAFRPGFLTNEYNRGRRVRYLSPLRMYLIVSLLFFFVASWLSAGLTVKAHIGASKVEADLAQAKREVKEARAEPAKPNPAPPRGQKPSSGGASKEADNPPTAKNDLLPDEKQADSRPSDIFVDGERLPDTDAEYVAKQRDPNNKNRHSPLKQFVTRQAIKVKTSPAEFLNHLIENAPRVMFVLLPIFALLLKLIYVRRKRYYVEHLVFALHGHAFVFLAFTVALLIPHTVASRISLVLAAVYLIAAMRVVYRQSWPKTLLKFGILLFSYLMLLAFSLFAVVVVTFLML